MKTYLRIYRWAMQMKLHMAMYTFVAIFLKILCNLLQGVDSISIRDLLTMWLVALVFAMVESTIFPEQAACPGHRHRPAGPPPRQTQARVCRRGCPRTRRNRCPRRPGRAAQTC